MDAISEMLDQGTHAPQQGPRCLVISEAGVKTGAQFAALMSAIMSDLIAGRIKPSIAGAVANAGGKLLKVVEMNQKYGTENAEAGGKILRLTD